MKLEYSAKSHVGKVRLVNEDSYGSFEPEDNAARERKGLLFLVADGMGGHRGGEVASKLAVEGVRSYYYSSEEDDPSKALYLAFESANKLILETAVKDVSLFGMGTTCTACAIIRDKAYFAHIGDSRAYLCRNGAIDQVTEDHSLVGEMVRSGIISSEDAKSHPKRNVITRSMGTQEKIDADTPPAPYTLKPGDIILLCSDGLTALVNDEEIKELLERFTPKDACRQLIDLANDRGGKDNITIQIIRISSN